MILTDLSNTIKKLWEKISFHKTLRYSILIIIKITQPVTSLCIVTFQKSFMDFKSSQNITLKYLGLNVKQTLNTCKCSFSYFSLSYATN